jgi:hypothetical protein
VVEGVVKDTQTHPPWAPGLKLGPHMRRHTMKTVISVGIAVALMLSVTPAMAGGTETFQAFSKMAAAEQARLTPLSDEQLVVIEGEGSNVCQFCSQSAANYSSIYQANVNFSSFSFVEQENNARVRQSIRQEIN